MPQMAPMPWADLYVYFIVIYLVFMLMVHYSKPLAAPQSSVGRSVVRSLNWKW